MRKVKFQNNYYYHIYNRGTDKRIIFNDKWDYVRFLKNVERANRGEGEDKLSTDGGDKAKLPITDADFRRFYFKPSECENSRKSSGSLALSSRTGSLALSSRTGSLALSSRTGSLALSSRTGSLALSSRTGSLASPPQNLVEIICYTLLPNHYHFLLRQLTENGIPKFMQRLGTGYTKYFNLKYKRSGCLLQGVYKSIPIKTNSYFLYLSAYIHGNPEIHDICGADDWTWSSYLHYLHPHEKTICNKNMLYKQFKSINDLKNYTNIVIKTSKSRKNEIKNFFLE